MKKQPLTKSKSASAPNERELEKLRHLAEAGDDAAAELLARWQSRRGGKWYDIARLELAVHEKTDIKITQKGRDLGSVQYVRMEAKGRGRSGESEWIVFQNEDDAEKYALADVEEQLQEEPSRFNQNWLQGFLTVSDTDKNLISSEEADNYVEDLDAERILSESDLQDEWDELQEAIDDAYAEQEELDAEEERDDKQWSKLQKDIEKLEEAQEKLVEQGREAVRESYAELIRERLDDPLKYAEELGFDVEREGLPAWISINTEAAAKSAIQVDGVAHFLDGYNGEETELPSGAVAFGTN